VTFEREARLEALRRLFHDDPAGRRYRHLESRAVAGYFLRYAGMFVRLGESDLARERGGRVLAVPLTHGERRHDIGTVESYCTTFVHYALRDPRFGSKIRALLDE